MTSTGGFRTVIVPAAGFGTRFLPATKSVPKELLPIVDTPGIEMIADEAAAAGAERMIIVTAPGKSTVAEYFQPRPDLENVLHARGKTGALARIRRLHGLLRIQTAVQEHALGLGHAVGCATPLLDDEDDAVAVLLPDDLLFPARVLTRMASVRARLGGSVLCAFEAEIDQLPGYGVFDVADTPDDDVKIVRGMVEKPRADQAPSRYACAGRYLLDRRAFDALKQIVPGARGEYDLTDAIALLVADGEPVHVVVHRGLRHDVGNPDGMLRAAIDLGLRDPDRGPDLRRWLGHRLSVG